jgi:hypothetical protein
MPRPLVHPRLLERLTPSFFVDRAAIQQLPAEALNALNDSTAQTDWQNMPGLSSIPCYVTKLAAKMGDEVRTQDTTFVASNFFVVLSGYFPQITETMRAVVTRPTDTLTLDIEAVYGDSRLAITKLEGKHRL